MPNQNITELNSNTLHIWNHPHSNTVISSSSVLELPLLSSIQISSLPTESEWKPSVSASGFTVSLWHTRRGGRREENEEGEKKTQTTVQSEGKWLFEYQVSALRTALLLVLLSESPALWGMNKAEMNSPKGSVSFISAGVRFILYLGVNKTTWTVAP